MSAWYMVSIASNSPIAIKWQQSDDTVHLEAFGQTFDGLSWDEFISRIDYLQREREKHQPTEGREQA